MRGEVSGSHYVEHRQIVNEKTLYVAARDQGDAGHLEATPFSLKLDIVSERLRRSEPSYSHNLIKSRDHRFRDKMPCRRTGLTRRQLPRWERPRSLVLTLYRRRYLFNSHTTVQLNFLYRDTHRSLSYDCLTMHSLLSLNVPFLWCKHLFSRISNCHTAATLLPLITCSCRKIRRADVNSRMRET